MHSRPQSESLPLQSQYVALKMLSQFPVNITNSSSMAFGQLRKLVYLFRPLGNPYGDSMSPYSVTPRHAYMNISRKSSRPMLLTPGMALRMVYISTRSSLKPLMILNRRRKRNVLSTATKPASPGTESSTTPAITIMRSNLHHGSARYNSGVIALISTTTSKQ